MELRRHVASKTPTAPAFNIPKSDCTAEMLRADLSDAGVAYENDAGRVFDFHALRGQFASALAAGGVHPKDAQELLRHSTIDLTMSRYTHVARGQLAKALNVLPNLSELTTGAARRTGTDDRAAVAEHSAPSGSFRCSLTQ